MGKYVERIVISVSFLDLIVQVTSLLEFFWGYEDGLDTLKGISVLICNSDKSRELFSETDRIFDFEEQDFKMAAQSNGQLNFPMSLSSKDYSVLSEWKEKN